MTPAVKFVMEFYNVSEEDAVKYYADEIEAYRTLLSLENE
jgi:hypothetical protein